MLTLLSIFALLIVLLALVGLAYGLVTGQPFAIIAMFTGTPELLTDLLAEILNGLGN